MSDAFTSVGDDFLVWVDCEMTGLDAYVDTIIEIAVIVTDASLTTVVEGPSIVIHHSEDVMSNMNDWCKNTFTKNGLWNRVRESTVSLQEAEQQVCDFVNGFIKQQKAPTRPVLCGNTIHMDKRFIDRHMPTFSAMLHYRLIDVSTVKELGGRWFKADMHNAPKKVEDHTALSDIRESIQELRFYRETLFKH